MDQTQAKASKYQDQSELSVGVVIKDIGSDSKGAVIKFSGLQCTFTEEQRKAFPGIATNDVGGCSTIEYLETSILAGLNAIKEGPYELPYGWQWMDWKVNVGRDITNLFSGAANMRFRGLPVDREILANARIEHLLGLAGDSKGVLMDLLADAAFKAWFSAYQDAKWAKVVRQATSGLERVAGEIGRMALVACRAQQRLAALRAEVLEEASMIMSDTHKLEDAAQVALYQAAGSKDSRDFLPEAVELVKQEINTAGSMRDCLLREITKPDPAPCSYSSNDGKNWNKVGQYFREKVTAATTNPITGEK